MGNDWLITLVMLSLFDLLSRRKAMTPETYRWIRLRGADLHRQELFGVEGAPEAPGVDGRPGAPGGDDYFDFGRVGEIGEAPGFLDGGADDEGETFRQLTAVSTILSAPAPCVQFSVGFFST